MPQSRKGLAAFTLLSCAMWQAQCRCATKGSGFELHSREQAAWQKDPLPTPDRIAANGATTRAQLESHTTAKAIVGFRSRPKPRNPATQAEAALRNGWKHR